MSEKTVRWYNLKPSDFEGRGWADTEAPFDRLPAKIKEKLPQVWENSHSSTGMCVFFNTNSTSFHVKYKLGSKQIGEQNFNVTAHCGVDLYIYDTVEKRWRWASATPHFTIKDQNPEMTLLGGLPSKMRRCRMYMPMRNQLLSISIGVDSDAEFELVPPRKKAPLVYYGTSIVHGAFSTRSGLGVAQILARKLDMPLINLGFSGAARMEKEMAELLAELNAGIFIADPYHNVSPDDVKNNTEPFIETLCSAHPKTPVFMLGAPQLLQAWLKPSEKAEQDAKTNLYGKICRRMMKKYPNLHYLKGENFYGSDEVSMDGVHPNDDAFAHMANILAREIPKRIGKKAVSR